MSHTCGECYCETCGDCLVCYGEDECQLALTGLHEGHHEVQLRHTPECGCEDDED